MTIEELKKIIKISVNHCNNFGVHVPEEADKFVEKVYKPVKKAIAEGNQEVVNYLLSCSKEERYGVITALEDALLENNIVNEGVILEGFENTIKLYMEICEENGFPHRLLVANVAGQSTKMDWLRTITTDNEILRNPDRVALNKEELIALIAQGMTDIYFADGDQLFSLKQAQQLYEAEEYEKTLPMLDKFAQGGHPIAQSNLGCIYRNGKGVKQDYKEAAAWFRKAAEQGNPFAQSTLGDMYLNGEGMEQNYKEFVAWCNKTAEQGNADAQNYLGTMYYYGEGVEQDYKEAVAWFRKAAEQGSSDAQNNLGCVYENGQGVEQDDKEAAVWYRKAAEQGDLVIGNFIKSAACGPY